MVIRNLGVITRPVHWWWGEKGEKWKWVAGSMSREKQACRWDADFVLTPRRGRFWFLNCFENCVSAYQNRKGARLQKVNGNVEHQPRRVLFSRETSLFMCDLTRFSAPHKMNAGHNTGECVAIAKSVCFSIWAFSNHMPHFSPHRHRRVLFRSGLRPLLRQLCRQLPVSLSPRLRPLRPGALRRWAHTHTHTSHPLLD